MTYRLLGNCKYDIEIPPPIPVSRSIEISIRKERVDSITHPEVWGPAFWFINHLGSVTAPEIIPPEKRDKYWGFIDGIPEMIPCLNCKEHAREFVDANRPFKGVICSSRNNLVKFFIDFHNKVNEKNNKPLITYEEIYRMFNSPVDINHFSYN
jgi:hypothetical protein